MYFKQVDEIISGAKTQTRRVCKDERYLFIAENGRQYTWGRDDDGRHAKDTETILDVRTASGRLKWQVGRTYAVQPKRGGPGVWYDKNGSWGSLRLTTAPHNAKPLRIRITEIRRERLGAITEADARAEGCPADEQWPILWYLGLWRQINGPKSADDNPEVWALSFEVVR